ncbi:MAG: hypothetical protein K2M98_04740 [Muribaculum sp.]|nr:hypothetical protein [Muribaculum sp.]
MNLKINLAIGALIALGAVDFMAAQSVTAESDQWAFTDGIGRIARDYEDAGERRDNKFVGLFYWTWHENRHNEAKRVVNVTKTVAEHPEAMKSYNSPYWGGAQKPDVFFWGEPLFGYYQTTDKWVLRKHAEMLADAGIDVVFFDCTNGSFLWLESFNALCDTWLEAMKDGVKVPKVAFLLPFSASKESLTSLRNLYINYYRPQAKKYSDLWFYWKGKPLIMAHPNNLTKDYPDDEIRNFFTFRPGQAGYTAGDHPSQWHWLQVYPQHRGYMDLDTRKFEQIAVGVAQNAAKSSGGNCCAFNRAGTYGRSYSMKNGWDQRENAYLYGWNFQEQWDRAINVVDPEFIFVTGWNEWHSGMWTKAHGWDDPLSFVDQYDWEHSRDCEPTADWGDKGDLYYWQLIDQVRRYKGMAPPAEVSDPKTIRFNVPSDWNDVLPRYVAYKGNTMHRNHPGYCEKHYTNSTGRNDIVGAKVTYDDENIYFRVETAQALSPSSDNNWMQLFIDIDRDKSTGWYGYDYIINHQSPSATGLSLHRCIARDKWLWARVTNSIKYSASGKVLQVAIPRSLIKATDTPNFEFKWVDNMQDEGNIMDFYVNGDAAPGGRFNYVYAPRDYSGIDDVVADTSSQLNAWSVSDGICVETEGDFSVYNISGMKVAQASGTGKVNVSAPGLYIVTDGVNKVKISVNK